LKEDIVEESVTKDGNAFQTRAPATGKERSPTVVLRVGGTTYQCGAKMLTAAAVLFCSCRLNMANTDRK